MCPRMPRGPLAQSTKVRCECHESDSNDAHGRAATGRWGQDPCQPKARADLERLSPFHEESPEWLIGSASSPARPSERDLLPSVSHMRVSAVESKEGALKVCGVLSMAGVPSTPSQGGKTECHGAPPEYAELPTGFVVLRTPNLRRPRTTHTTCEGAATVRTRTIAGTTARSVPAAAGRSLYNETGRGTRCGLL